MGRVCFSWQRGAALKTLLLLDGFCAYANGNQSCTIGTLVPDQKKPTELPLKKGSQGTWEELTVMKQKTRFLVYLGAVISSSLEKFQIPLKIHWSPDPWAQKCKELRTHSIYSFCPPISLFLYGISLGSILPDCRVVCPFFVESKPLWHSILTSFVLSHLRRLGSFIKYLVCTGQPANKVEERRGAIPQTGLLSPWLPSLASQMRIPGMREVS